VAATKLKYWGVLVHSKNLIHTILINLVFIVLSALARLLIILAHSWHGQCYNFLNKKMIILNSLSNNFTQNTAIGLHKIVRLRLLLLYSPTTTSTLYPAALARLFILF